MKELTLDKICCNCMTPLKSGVSICPVCGFDRDVYNSPPEALPPETILGGKYLLGKCLGVGGFGITYLALDLKDKKRLAIKEYFPSGLVIRETIAQGNCRVEPVGERERRIFRDGVQSYLKEGEHLAIFRKVPNIVTIKEYFTENNTAYLVMDFVDGQTAAQYLKTKGVMTPEQAVSYLAPIIESLIIMHGQGLIHRDISPANIMITPDGKAILIDFGATRNYLENRKNEEIIVKPGYAPVEQYSDRSGNQGPWTDVYALCATMYRMITGKVPVESVARKNGDRLPLPSEYGVGIQPELERILMKGLNILPRDRYQTLRELYGDLYGYMARKAQREFDILGGNDSGRAAGNSRGAQNSGGAAGNFRDAPNSGQSGFEKEKAAGSQKALLESGGDGAGQDGEVLKRRTPYLIGAAALAVVVLLSGALLIGVSHTNQPLDNTIQDVDDALRIPNLEGMTVEEAMAELEKSGLEMKVAEVNYSDAISNGVITGQEPEKGEKASSGDVVSVRRSGGSEEVMMADLSGMDKGEAVSWLKKQNLLEQVNWLEDAYEESLYSDTLPEDAILSQSVEAGAIYTVGVKPLELGVCQGSLEKKTDEMPVPKLVGQTVSKAAKKILPKQAGENGHTFVLEDEDQWTSEFSWDYEPGTIISQEPAAGETARTIHKIRITVARELGDAEVPNVVGMEVKKAEQTLHDAHLAVDKSKKVQSDSVPRGQVIALSYTDGDKKEQKAEAGMRLPEKTSVTMTVSGGKNAKPADSDKPKTNEDAGTKQPVQPETPAPARQPVQPETPAPSQQPVDQQPPAPSDGGGGAQYDPSLDVGGGTYDPSLDVGGGDYDPQLSVD